MFAGSCKTHPPCSIRSNIFHGHIFHSKYNHTALLEKRPFHCNHPPGDIVHQHQLGQCFSSLFLVWAGLFHRLVSPLHQRVSSKQGMPLDHLWVHREGTMEESHHFAFPQEARTLISQCDDPKSFQILQISIDFVMAPYKTSEDKR